MRYVDCTYLEIAAHANNGWLALIPMGCTEQQGPHLGVGFDTWFAEELLLTASQQAATDHHRHPESVRADRVPGPSHRTVDWDDPGLDFTAYSSSGVIGDPRHGSAERGAALWSECVAWTVGLIRQVAATEL